jgi:PAS domain S-box-containing protein
MGTADGSVSSGPPAQGSFPHLAGVASDLLDALHSVLPFDSGSLELHGQVVATRGLPPGRWLESRGSIRMPLTVGDEAVGALTLKSLEPNRYTSSDSVIVAAFARAAASAMVLAHCHETERIARQRGELLAAATEAVSSTLDVREIYSLILQHLRRVVPYDCASIQELQGDELVVLGGVGFPDNGAAVGLRFDVRSPDSPNGEVIRRCAPVVLEDAPLDYPAFRSGPPAEVGIHSWIGVPLLFGARPIGMITLDKRERAFYTREHADAAVAYARRVAIAMEHARLYSASQRELAQRQAAEAALRESESRFRQVTEAIEEAFWLTDAATGQVVYISPAYESIWGRTCQSLYDAPFSWFDAVIAEDRPSVRDAWVDAQAGTGYDIRYRIARPDGTTRWVRDRAFPIRDADGNVRRVAGVAEDITERHQLEQQYLQAQKMEAIGLLAGGVAHDFNNVLGVILACAELLRKKTGPNDPRRRTVDEIAKSVERASILVRQLLAFGRKQFLAPKVLDLNLVLMEMEKLLRRLLREDIELKVSAAADLGKVSADPAQIEQVIMNLVVNARDAMPAGGTLTIELMNAELDEDYARHHPSVKPGPFVMLAVTDTGAGMDAETQARIFEPFFTTKEAGQGTGLGLATVYGVVKQSNGYIWVYSEVGLGTTFKIYLPRVDRPVESCVREATPDAEVRGVETVLLVEDDQSLREVTQELLESGGYTVLSARDGAEALAVADEYEGNIDLLLTDVVMPGMNGPDLAARMVSKRPGLKVLYASGYTDATLHRDIVDRGAMLIQKPFTAAALTGKVRDALREPS